MKDEGGTTLGLDVGSVAMGFVELDRAGAVRSTGYAYHHGRVEQRLPELLASVDWGRVGAVACTSSTPDTVRADARFDGRLAAVAAARERHDRVGSLWIIGGERFSLLRFDAGGAYRECRESTSCAAGTGSFLDQLASSLGVEDAAALAVAAARAPAGQCPTIASRCAVFAKTDLIHAQQEGFSRESICDGLCRGLAASVVDTVLAGEPLVPPVIVAGGVARNSAVLAHLRALTGAELVTDDLSHLYGALGAALLLARGGGGGRGAVGPRTLDELVEPAPTARPYEEEPLRPTRSRPAELGGAERLEVRADRVGFGPAVEVEVYAPPAPGSRVPVVLGIDVGSTSTKAVLLDQASAEVVAGLYTRTAGQPVTAVQALLEVVDGWRERDGLRLDVVAAGTTGAGRKLAGAVVGADRVLDEITAHAIAATRLDPEVDTIIEIGGQDSKFTTLRHGRVTSAIMNTVCAAGTGSFIEEQAHRLGCRLADYAREVEGARAPLVSDRCTVFMQRDVGYFINRGYSVPEILAAVLHAVRDNYLRRVAREGAIGRRITFQGATARNAALVAAFEQRLGKPITVSRYCHLTGALGVALSLREEPVERSGFRGLELYRDTIPVRGETCTLCNNRCKITLAEVRGRTTAYGFLCGRDHDVHRYVPRRADGFDLPRARARALGSRAPHPTRGRSLVVGLPAALCHAEDAPLWRDFFSRLGVRVVSGEGCKDPVTRGKSLARAELCAPMMAFHGQVAWLAERTDVVFAPLRLEADERPPGTRRQYCYYTQYASSLVETALDGHARARLLAPELTDGLASLRARASLYGALRRVIPDLSLLEVTSALGEAVTGAGAGRERLREIMDRERPADGEVAVVLLGRPYTVLSPRMNKGIPALLAAQGVRCFFQDMLRLDPRALAPVAALGHELHWKYATELVEAAQTVAVTPGLYPVLVTSFHCTPDSCTIDFAKGILDDAGKPYLVLELDEHDSSVGYETRIEAAVRAFRNHHAATTAGASGEGGRAASRAPLALAPASMREVRDRTVFIPRWDPLSCELVAANLAHAGIDARVLHEDAHTIQRGLRLNTGQCVPLTAILESFFHTVEASGVDPARTALWLFRSHVACNIGMFPAVWRAMLDRHGRGFERAAVVTGDVSFRDVSLATAVGTYFAFLLGGLLRRAACKLRPYEVEAGSVDRAVAAGLVVLRTAFTTGRSRADAAREVVDSLARVPVRPGSRPKVAVFGDLYARDNDVMNQDLLRAIEDAGGEAVTTPFTDYVRMIARPYFRRWLREGAVRSLLVNDSLLRITAVLERGVVAQFERILGPLGPPRLDRPVEEVLDDLGITTHHTGESFDNAIKVAHLVAAHPDLRLFVQASPAGCCPSIVTEAMRRRIEAVTGVPVVSLEYDGTASPKNTALLPYLALGGRAAPAVERRARGRGAGRAGADEDGRITSCPGEHGAPPAEE